MCYSFYSNIVSIILKGTFVPSSILTRENSQDILPVSSSSNKNNYYNVKILHKESHKSSGMGPRKIKKRNKTFRNNFIFHLHRKLIIIYKTKKPLQQSILKLLPQILRL